MLGWPCCHRPAATAGPLAGVGSAQQACVLGRLAAGGTRGVSTASHCRICQSASGRLLECSWGQGARLCGGVAGPA
eukprot:3774856-Alexandrium_andersonii.AAC.1